MYCHTRRSTMKGAWKLSKVLIHYFKKHFLWWYLLPLLSKVQVEPTF